MTTERVNAVYRIKAAVLAPYQAGERDRNEVFAFISRIAAANGWGWATPQDQPDGSLIVRASTPEEEAAFTAKLDRKAGKHCLKLRRRMERRGWTFTLH